MTAIEVNWVVLYPCDAFFDLDFGQHCKLYQVCLFKLFTFDKKVINFKLIVKFKYYRFEKTIYKMSSINPSLVDSINSDVVMQNDILSIITSEGSSNEETDIDEGFTMNNIDSSSSDESTDIENEPSPSPTNIPYIDYGNPIVEPFPIPANIPDNIDEVIEIVNSISNGSSDEAEVPIPGPQPLPDSEPEQAPEEDNNEESKESKKKWKTK